MSKNNDQDFLIRITPSTYEAQQLINCPETNCIALTTLCQLHGLSCSLKESLHKIMSNRRDRKAEKCTER